MPIITLTTDFGASHYVGAVKGVIYSLCSKTQVVDITHKIQKFNIRQAAYVLHASAPYFPRGTIHLVVVDPGVGTERRGIVLKTRDHYYVGPDNGVFSFAEFEKAWEILLPSKSATFHGRDVFAPAAARLACGEAPENLGREIREIRRIKFSEAALKQDKISGEVIFADDFGSLITNIPRETINKAKIKPGAELSLKLKNRKHRIRFVETYGFAKKGELICLIGSSGFVEIAVNQGSAAKKLKAQGGEKVEIKIGA